MVNITKEIFEKHILNNPYLPKAFVKKLVAVVSGLIDVTDEPATKLILIENNFQNEDNIISQAFDGNYSEEFYYNNSYSPSYSQYAENFKRLNLDEITSYYIDIARVYKNAFLKANQCCDQTILLYVEMISQIREFDVSFDNGKNQIHKVIIESPTKNRYGNFQFNVREETSIKIFQFLFRKAENILRSRYKLGRMYDDTWLRQSIERKFGQTLLRFLNDFTNKYSPEPPTFKTEITLNEINKTRWKVILNDILEVETPLNDKINKINLLIKQNCTNPSQHLIYLELCKKLIKYDANELRKVVAWYYFCYRVYGYQNQKYINVTSVNKFIFDGNTELEKEFFELAKTMIDKEFKHDSEQQRLVEQLLVPKRKKLNLNQSIIADVQSGHHEMVNELNIILQDDEIRPIVESIVKTNYQDTEFELSTDELALLQLMKQFNYIISRIQFEDFTRSYNQSNIIIKNINRKFFEKYEENIIEKSQDEYFISSEKQQYLK